MAEYPYEVISPGGQPVMEATESCRYPRHIEKDMLEAGYTIRLHGKKITKTDVRKDGKGGMYANSRKQSRRSL